MFTVVLIQFSEVNIKNYTIKDLRMETTNTSAGLQVNTSIANQFKNVRH